MTMAKKGYLGVFGTVILQKEFCQSCQAYSIVKHGYLICCDMPVYGRPEKWKRESLACGMRSGPSAEYKKNQLNIQNYRCFYCLRVFGFTVLHKHKPVRLRVEWDHLVPFAFLQSNPDENFVAACQICNSLKSSKVFQTVEEARLYVATQIEIRNGKYKAKGD